MVWRVGLYSDVTCSHYRRLAELQFMVWQVVWHCAAASGSGTAAGLQRAKRCESTPTALQTASRNPVSLDSLHLIHGVNTFYAAKDLYALPNTAIPSISESPHPHSVTPGDTERSGRVQFMVRRVGLYTTNTSRFARQQVKPALPAATRPHGKTRRLQFMAGRVGLYIDVTYSLQRPDSKRPQALKSRVAAREAVWPRALPVLPTLTRIHRKTRRTPIYGLASRVALRGSK